MMVFIIKYSSDITGARAITGIFDQSSKYKTGGLAFAMTQQIKPFVLFWTSPKISEHVINDILCMTFSKPYSIFTEHVFQIVLGLVQYQ